MIEISNYLIVIVPEIPFINIPLTIRATLISSSSFSLIIIINQILIIDVIIMCTLTKL